jgi:hypothetical protein
MVDSWRSILEMEVFWSQFSPVDLREASVFLVFMVSIEFTVFTSAAGA